MTITNLNWSKLATYAAGAFLISLGGSIALGVAITKALALAAAAALTAGGSFLQHPDKADSGTSASD